MSRLRLVYLWSALLIACSGAEVGSPAPGSDAGVCEDRDHDGYGRNCARGYDCNDDDPKATTECRSCSQPELGCACAAGAGPSACFLPDKALPGGDVVCSEGTRFCRDGVWGGCESVHEYVVAPKPDTQRVVDPRAGQATCSVCDLKCFKVVDNLLADAGTAGGNVTFAAGGGLTLLPGDGGMTGGSTDAGSGGLTGCMAMAACCSTLSDSLKTACNATVAVANNARCDQERVVFCPPGNVNGPVTGCTFGSGADTDCDGIPNVVDSLPGKPLATSNNQTIFHQLDIGETGQNSLDITFKLRNADVYFLLDMTNTMKEERDNLISSLTNGNVVNCAHLNQCCNRENDPAKKKACQDAIEMYTKRPGLADDQASCLAEQKNYCPGGMPLDCPDQNFDGQPDNALKEQGVVGATRCLVGSSWFGAGFSREIPIIKDPEGCSSSGCGTVSYGDRDEVAFRHVVDMTSDYERVRTALSSMVTNGNWDEPEGGMMALYSVITGKGHYFGINRPSIPSRLNATGCPPDSFGYPCFRKSAIPIVVFFTDRPHHNGPDDPSHCAGQGAGCPYDHLTNGATPGRWASGANESASDKQATRVPADAESFATAYNAGDIRGRYLSLVGDTRFMVGDYPTAIVGCAADPASPDALVRFKVDPPPGATGTVPPINVNFHLTKDDVYDASKYGTWRSDRTNDPSPAMEFGSVISVFRGTPTSVSSTLKAGESTAIAIASGPDSTYLTYEGRTNGQASAPGFLGGITGCGADGSTNQVLFTFRPTANAHIVVDASESRFPTAISLHQGLPSALPKNPTTIDGTSQAIANTNDTFASANVIPATGTAIDGRYLERTGDTKVSTIKADYTATTQRYTFGTRVNGSHAVEVKSLDGLYVGMQLASSANWSASPVVITNITGNIVTLSASWLGATDSSTVSIGFLDSLVGCGVDPAGNDAVFKFDVATPRKVRIDTEGSAFDTVISLHDAPPPSIITKTDVSGNGTTPGYSIGDVTNASYTLSDVGSGTTAFGSTYDYQQCGAAKTSKDAAFTFQLSKPTHLSLEVTSSTWNPIVALFGSQPGSATTLNNATNSNDRIAPPTYMPFNIGDVYGQLDTRVTGSSLSSLLDDYNPSAVGCSAVAGGRDAIFSFTPSNSTTVRLEANPTGGWLPVISVFDGPPPVGGVIGTTQLYDATTVAVPDSNCLIYSYRDPSGGATPHTYAVCPTRRYNDDAQTRCVSAGMNYLASINSADEQQFLANRTSIPNSLYNFHMGAVDPDGDGDFAWSDGTTLASYTNWGIGEPKDKTKNKCATIAPSGAWMAGRCTLAGATTADNTYYVCEDASPAVTPPEDAVSAISVNPYGTVVNVTGSTRRMSSDYNGATLLTACGGTISAGDAVFKVVTGTGVSYTLSVDSAGSSYSPVLGLFEGSIDAAGYKACDAAGGAALTHTLLANRTYYVLVKGTAASPEGTYKLKFADASALAASGSRLGCMAGTASVPKASVDVDVDANHTYYVVVDQATSAFGAFELLAHGLYRARAEVANADASNETGSNAVALPDPYRSRITVIDTSTAGMTADYGLGSNGMCTASAGAPDAVYRFTPSLNTDVRFTVTPKGSGLSSAAIGVFDGLPGTSAVLHDLNTSGNTNEALASAESVILTGPAQQYLGNTAAMAANVDPSVLSCGAYPNGRDAVFSFKLTQPTAVEVDASASSVSDPVINLFRSSPLSKPAQVTLENDTKQQADQRPTPTPTVTTSWLSYGGDMTRLTAESQSQLSVAALNSETPASNQPHDLGDISGKRVTVSGGDTSPMQADYPGNWSCGANDAAPDAIYKFYSSTNATVHVKATPGGSFDTVLGLYDGTNGLPLRLSDVSSVVEDNACVAPNAPKNLTNATLKAIAPVLGTAPAANLNCGATVVWTTDPDGTGSANASFVNWCGTQPLTFVQPQADGPELVVFVVQSLSIAAGSSLRVLGTRPAVIIVNGSANIAGTLSVTPDEVTYPGVSGAGGDYACGLSQGGNAAVSGSNSGGGGGGGFGTAGGLGGYGSDANGSAGGVAGATRGNASLVPLLGGCSGGHAAAGSRVGLAGGALQLSATGTITVGAGGSIAANGGAGPLGASGEAGGSGGGSGGAILLQAPSLSYSASQLSARGGAGGQGVGTSSVAGGTGAADASSAGSVGQNSGITAGGGGGGGGYGRVTLVTGTVSLAPCTAATNENASSAWPIMLDGSGRQYIERGNTSGMASDHAGMCGTPVAAPDAVYAFTLSKASTVQIDASRSGANTVLGLYNAGNLGQSPTPVLLENDTTADADAAPAPTPTVTNNYVSYRGNLANLSVSGQPQISIDNGGNANEIIPTDLPDPINRRVTVVNANTSAMSADYLAATCSMPAADPARDAIYRFVPSQSGLVRVSANYAATSFDPVVALYRGTHQVIDERVTLINLGDTGLAKLNADGTSVKVRNLARTTLYAGPGSATPDYSVVVRDAKTPVSIVRTATSTIPNGATVSVDYDYDSGAPLPISQQQTTSVDLGALGNPNENASNAAQVPVRYGEAYSYSGNTTAMSADVDGSLFTCGPPALTSNDATFSFSLDRATTVSIDTGGSGYNAAIALFDSPYTRPSTTVLRSPAAVEQRLYDVRAVPGSPESSCVPYDYNTHRYWLCSSERPWSQAEGMCQAVGLHLVTIEDSFENAALFTQVQPTGKAHHIGFQETVPYTASWGAWTSGGGGTTGSSVSSRFTRWASGEPNGLGDCLQMLSTGTWDDEDCGVTHAYVCEQNNTTTPLAVPSGSTCGSVLTYGGHMYRACTDSLPWASARARCTSVGMDLARVEDTAENDQLRVLLAGKAGWIGGNDSATEGQWVWADNAGFWLVNAYRNWSAGEPNEQSLNPGSRMRFEDGTWVDTPITYQGYRYICEDPAPGVISAPPTATAPQSVSVFSSARQFRGSTESTPNSVGGFIGCGASPAAPDAVFALTLPYTSDLRVDVTGSFANNVLGLFRGAISAQGYTDAGSRCALGSAAGPQLVASALPAGTYYVVLTGAVSASGAYRITFDAQSSDPAAFRMQNDNLADAMANPLGSIDGKWLVKRTDMSLLTPTLGAVRVVNMGAGTDVNDVNPQVLDPVNGYQVQVANASTGDLAANYPAGTAGTCSASANGADAMYRFTASTNGNVQVRLNASGWTGQVVLYDGTSGAPLDSGSLPAAPINLAPANANETPASAQSTPIGGAQAFLGSLTPMAADVAASAFNQSYNRGAGSPISCSADLFGKDAFFKFNVGPAAQTVEISSIGTSPAHTIALWDDKPFTKPAGTTATYDNKAAANMLSARLGTGDSIDDDWVVVRGDTSMLSPSLGYTTWTETVNYPHDDSVHPIGNVKGKQLVTVNATTSTLAADYLASTLQCGIGSDAARDAIFSFSHSTGGKVRLSLNNPGPAFVPNLALFKGEPGKAVGINPVETAVSGNEARGSAHAALSPSSPRVYSGNTATMAADQDPATFSQGTAYGSNVCAADASGKDAFISFTLTGTTTVELSTVSASFDHSIALWDSTPITAPAATAMSNDTRAAANANAIGAIDDTWVVKTATMSSLMPGGLTANPVSTSSNNEVQNLGDPVGKRITTSGNTSTSGVVGDYTTAQMSCGSSDSANDIVYKIRPTANTSVRVATNNPSNPGFSNALAVFNGSTGELRRVGDTTASVTTTYCSGGTGFGYTPANVNMASVSFASAPTVTLGCGTTVTFNSTTNTWTGYCAGQTQPTAVVQTQTSGPDIVVLPFKALTVNAGTTLSLIGARPVAILSEGNVSVAGTINASGSGATAGAGGNWTCGGSTGGNGSDVLSVRSGAGGGGFGTKGGDGGFDGFSTDGGAGGATRGNSNLVPLIGGCGGGVGANCGGSGGAGGGAFQISAGGTVTVTGVLRADGGTATAISCGWLSDGSGGGGGSGGAILLEGTSISTSGTVSTNGGNGASGSNGSGGGGATSSAGTGATGGNGAGDGSGGGGGGFGRTRQITHPCAPSIESFGSAQVVPIGQTQTYTGPSGAMTSDLAGTSFRYAGACTPDATGPDAFFRFTVTATTAFNVTSASTNYNHTITLFDSSQVSMACSDGAATTGTSITRSLSAGTYYVGIKTRGSSGGTFRLAFSDTNTASRTNTTTASPNCSTTNTLDVALTANTDYYVVVKGASAGLAGAYNLTVTDIGAVTNFGCSTDLSAPDAYFEFDVNAASGRTVTIALTEGGTNLNGSFQLVRDGAPLNNASGDTAYLCDDDTATYTLPQGKYYVLVRGMSVVSGAGNLPLTISIRDDSGMNALDCATGTSSSAGTITATLPAGTYYAGIKSRNGSAGGAYKLRLRDTSVSLGGGGTWLGCADGSYTLDYTIPPGDANVLHYAVIKGAAASAEGRYTLSVTDLDSVADTCAASDPIQMDPTAPDAFYAFKVADGDSDGRDVTVSLATSSVLDGAYRLFRADGTPVGDCHDRSGPFTYTNLPANTYYLALRGKSTASGAAEASFELSINDQDAYGSIECKDAAASSGTTLTRTLSPGNYWLGIKTQAGAVDPQSYRIQFRDTANPTPTNATELGCDANVISTAVTAGKPYYVLVKGTTPADSGPYTLSVTDLTTNSGFGCNDDAAAGDAYYEFNVNDPNGRHVTIDTQGSALDTVVALFPAGAPIAAGGYLACDDNSGATTGSSKISRDLGPGVYYVVVRARQGAANPGLPFELSVRDDSTVESIACGASDGSGPAKIRAELGAGTYHVVLKGMPGSDKGAYKLRIRDEGPYLNAASEVACNDTQNELLYNVTAGKPYYAVVKGAATNQSGPYKLTVENLVAQVGMGCGANPASPDAVYRFHLSADTRVAIDTIGSQTSGSTPVPTDTVIGLYDLNASYFGTNYAEDKNRAAVSCDDNGADASKGWSRIVADLAGNRDYYVVVKSKTSGWGSSQLPYVVNVRDLNANQPIACADVNSSLLMTRTLPAGDYRVVVSNSTGATGGAPFDVRFRNTSVSNSGATQVACSDTPDELTYNVVAGRPYYLVVKGDAATDRGQYGLVVETTGTGATSMGCGANPAAPDAFFKFNVTKSGPVVIDTDGSTADTVIAVYPSNTAVFGTNYAQDTFGNTIPCDDNSGATAGASRIATTLAQGSYYLVVKGKTLSWNQAAQPFNVSIRDSDSTGSIACASASVGGKKLLQTLPAGDYNVVMSTASATGGAYSLKFRDTAKASAESGSRVQCGTGSVTVSNLTGGHEYYVVVKGNNASDAGGYNLTLEDTVSLAAASGSTSIACAADGSKIDGVYPAGTYYALVTGDNSASAGPYTLKASDVDALTDQNRLACNDDSGPNRTSIIERNVAAGTHYVVVKGKGADQKGAYALHVRDADAVPDRNLACGGAGNSERLEYDVQAGQDYTVLLKGDALNQQGQYTLKLYDQYGLQNNNGQRLTCVSDAQPTPLVNSSWHTRAVDFNLSLTPDTYYIAVKGQRATDKGNFQLQFGEPSARTSTTYTPPSWTEVKDALAASEVRVLPVIATGGDTSAFVAPAEAQASTVALTTRAVRQDGTPIWQKIQKDGRGTGSGLITGIAEIADYLSLDVSLVAVDGPDPGASRFRIGIAPVNSPSCVHPHPLVDTVTGACTPRPNDPRGYNCNTQYSCAPGSAPKFTVTFTNPSDAPVPPNPNDAYGGYHFKMQIYGNKKYLLEEVPVYIIPTSRMMMGPPTGGSGKFQSTGTYSQDVDAASCPKLSTGSVVTNDLPTWSDLFFNADVPEGSSIDFELCTADTTAGLTSCRWSDGTSGTRKKITVRSKGSCTDNTQCRNVAGYGSGFCSAGTCQFIQTPKIAYDVACTTDAACPNGPLGAGDYLISSRCETTRGAPGYGYCVYTSQPADLGGTLLTGEQGRAYARIKVTLNSDSSGAVAPTLYQWYLTYFCKSAQ